MKNKFIIICFLMLFLLFSSCFFREQKSYIIRDPNYKSTSNQNPTSMSSSDSSSTKGTDTLTDKGDKNVNNGNQEEKQNNNGQNNNEKIQAVDISNLPNCNELAKTLNNHLNNNIIDLFSKCNEKTYLLLGDDDSIICILNKKNSENINDINDIRLIKFFILDQKVYKIHIFVPKSLQNLKDKNREDGNKDKCVSSISNEIQQTQTIQELFKVLILINNFFYSEKSEKITLCYNESSLSILNELLSFLDLSLNSLKRTFEKKCNEGERERNILEIISEKSKKYNYDNVLCFEKNQIKDLKSLSTIFGKYYWNYENCENVVAQKLLIITDKNELKVSLLKDLNLFFLFKLNYDNLVVNGKINETLVAFLLNFSYYLNNYTKDSSRNEEILRSLKIVSTNIKPTINLTPESSDKNIDEFIIKNFFNETFLSLNDFIFPSILNVLYYPLSEKEKLSNAVEDLKKIIGSYKEISCSVENDICNIINKNKKFFNNYSYLIEFVSYKKNISNPYLLYSFVFIQDKNVDVCKKSENLVNDILDVTSGENVLESIEKKFDQKCLGLIVAYSRFFSFVYSRPNYDFARIEKKDVNVQEVKYKITPKSSEEFFKFCDDTIQLIEDENVSSVQILLKSKEKELIINQDKKLEEGITFEDELNKINITYDTDKKIIIQCEKKINSELFKGRSEIIEELIVKYEIGEYNLYHKKFNFSLAELSLEGKDNEELNIFETKYSYNFNITGFGDNVNSLQDALNVFNEIKFNGANIKDKTDWYKFENKKLVLEVNLENIKDQVEHTFEFLYLGNYKRIIISRKINVIKSSIMVEGKLLAKLGKLNKDGITSPKIDVPLSNMNVTLIVDEKEYSNLTDSNGTFKLILYDVSLNGKKVDIRFFYQRRFLNKLNAILNYSNEKKWINEKEINTVKSNNVLFNISFNNFCNEAVEFYKCKENNIVEFNLIITTDKNKFNSNVDKNDYESIFYTYHFLEQVIDFYTELVKDDSMIKNSEGSNFEVIVAPNVDIKDVAGLFDGKGKMFILKNSYLQLHKYLFTSLAHEFTHFVLELKHQLLNNQYVGICLNSNVSSQNNCNYDLSFDNIRVENYGGIMNPSTVDSVNEALARLIEKIILEEFYLKKEQSLYEKEIKLSHLEGRDLEINEIPYSFFNKEPYDFNEIFSIASFFNDLLDNTTDETILSKEYINNITKNLNQNIDEQEEIKDKVYLNYIDFWKEIILNNYDNFNFYNIYKKIIENYSSQKEEIEKIAKTNLLYYNNRTGNKEIGNVHKIHKCTINFIIKKDPCDVKDNIKDNISIDFFCRYSYPTSPGITFLTILSCNNKENSSLNKYPCQKYLEANLCKYELYTFIYNKSQQGEVGIISFDGHYLKYMRRKLIKEFPESQLLIKEPISDVYLVEVKFLENYGIDNYSYVQKLDEENKLYIPPIPSTYLAEIRVKPYFDEQNYSVKKEYVINSREMNERIINSDKDYFDEVKFEIISENMEKSSEEDIKKESSSLLEIRKKDKSLKLLVISLVIILSILIFVYFIRKKEQKNS
ncbi:MAG: hypothetical protein QXS41_02275 [Candidatus Woesearchaeota archaeon]